MTYIMSCVWLDYMVKYFQCKNCVGSSPKTKKCVASFLVPVYKKERSKRFVLFLSIAKAMVYHQSVRIVYHHALACIKALSQ